jgi:hypothetical protein
MTWSAFAKHTGSSLPQISVAAAREKLATLLVKMNGKFGCNGTLPW